MKETGRFVKISEMHPWDKNPKIIRDEKFELLKKALQEEGQDLPIIIDSRKGNEGAIISGNMRYQALKELGVETIWVLDKETKDDAHFFKLAVQHNMQYGEYVSEQILELANMFKDQLELSELDIYLSPPIELDFHLENFGEDKSIANESEPDNTSEEIDMDDKTKNLKHTCPKCGFEFE